MSWEDKYKEKFISAKDAAGLVKSGDYVVFALDQMPHSIAHALAGRAEELQGVTLTSTWIGVDYPWFHPGMEGSFNVRTSFATPVVRKAVQDRVVDSFFWVPGLGDGLRQAEPMRSRIHQNADVYYCRVTPPDEDGYCSFGHSLWYSPVAVRTAKTAVAEVASVLPYTYGDRVHISELDYLVKAPEGKVGIFNPAGTLTSGEQWELAQVIGVHAAELIRDGDTFQLGFGGASEAIVDFLATKNDLGIDTEMIHPQEVELMKIGIINGKRKNVNTGKVIATAALFVEGHPDAPAMKDFLDHNLMFEFHDASYILNVPRIASNDNMVAVNSIIGIDLYGQVAIEQWNRLTIGGAGGQLEYVIGSHYSRGGRSISCLISVSDDGRSRVVPYFEEAALATIYPGYVDYLVTEHGVVNLEFMSRRERAEAIISIAHPDFRTELTKAARKMFWP